MNSQLDFQDQDLDPTIPPSFIRMAHLRGIASQSQYCSGYSRPKYISYCIYRHGAAGTVGTVFDIDAGPAPQCTSYVKPLLPLTLTTCDRMYGLRCMNDNVITLRSTSSDYFNHL